MRGFADIHTHLLPGVDDGAQELSQTIQLLRMAWKDGIRTVVLTPHYRGRYKQSSPKVLKEKFAWLREVVAAELPDLQLYLGQEIAFESDAPEAMYQRKVLSINDSQYVLLEFSANSLRSQIITGVNETIRYGFVPIVAHVERYDIVRKQSDLVDELLDMGALLQLNADSILGSNGFGIKRYCHKLLKAKKVHFVASDAHDAIYRPPLLRKCFLHVHKKYGQDYAIGLFSENAQMIVENRMIE